MQQAPAGQTYHLPPNSLAGVNSAAHPNTGGLSITDFKRSVNLPIPRHTPRFKAWRQIEKDHLLATNFTPLANFPIADIWQIVAAMRILLPACDQLATAPAANNVVNMQQADEGVVQLVKDCIDKLITTLNRRAQKAANGHVLGAIGQPGLAPAQLIVPTLLLLLGAPVQWSTTTAYPNPAPVPQKAFPAMNQQLSQGQVVSHVILDPPQPLISQPLGQAQAQSRSWCRSGTTSTSN